MRWGIYPGSDMTLLHHEVIWVSLSCHARKVVSWGKKIVLHVLTLLSQAGQLQLACGLWKLFIMFQKNGKLHMLQYPVS